MEHDPYVYDNGVLINKFNVKEQKALNDIERRKTHLKALEIENGEVQIKQTFDYNHLKSIHKHLFSDIYEWAGEQRTVDIFKSDSLFAFNKHIEPETKKLFNQLNKENHLKGLDQESISDRLAYYMGEINAIHPFREGNGRTQRLFISPLLLN